ncbi:hypothetical protein Patl1_26382 [Pistacia atlantica]|uniref:Uncharacterized protein n=1 Tax=Pistacia atlantica TaxID=434234 RepID=A0ACC1AZH9_9ROSI|nr:hypothetical protein Patl1_26382 [Pistacia atlantica]
MVMIMDYDYKIGGKGFISNNGTWQRIKMYIMESTSVLRPGANSTSRAKFTKILSNAEAKPFLSMTYLDGNKWVLPPPKV